MQCPLSDFCMSPKVLFSAIGFLGLALGIFSVGWPRGSIGLYEWTMERFNWKVAPIDESREVWSTRLLGIVLVLLSLAIFVKTFSLF